MNDAAAFRALLPDLGVALVVADQSGGVTEAVAALRAACEQETGFVLMIIGVGADSITRAMLLAATGPLAVEFAPTTRLCAIEVAEGAEASDVATAARFLAAARGTTGQVLRVAG